MAEATQKYTLSPKQMTAARLTAEDELSDEAIAAEVGITRKALWSWRKRPDFIAAVDEQREAFRNLALTQGFADKRARLKALDGLAQDILREMAEEASEDKPKGTYRKEVKIAANGEIVEYEVFDKPKVDTFRGLLDDIAQEMGERKTGIELSGDEANPLVLGLLNVDLGKV